MKDKPAAFYVPVNFDLTILPKELRWYAAYLLNLIHWKWICRRVDEDGFVRLKWAYLTRVIPRKVWRSLLYRYLSGYYDHRTGIEHPAVIETHVSGKPKECRGYRLAPGYHKTRRIVCTDERINRKIQKAYAKGNRGPLPVLDWLRGNMDLLEIDVERSHAVIAGLKPKRRSREGVEEYRLKHAEYVQRIASGDHWFQCDKYGRVHTPITALKRELRSCLSAGGEPLVNIDLANSQPLLLGMYACRYLTARGRMARHRLLNKSFDGRTQPYRPQEVRKMACSRSDGLPDDLVEYLRTCEQGKFYESMMSERDKGKGKVRFKQRFFRVLFGKSRTRGRYPNALKAALKARYPSVATVLRKLKERNYRASAWVLQNFEATIFIRIVCGRIMNERPDTVLFTIHDSIMTTADAAAHVAEVIRDEFRKLGITPTLREEPCQ